MLIFNLPERQRKLDTWLVLHQAVYLTAVVEAKKDTV